MCISAAASFRAYIIAVIALMILIYCQTTFSITIGCFILVYSTIQLLEGFIWLDRQKKGLSASSQEAVKNIKSNAISSDGLTRTILVCLWLQPLVQMYFAYRYCDLKYKNLLLFLTIIYFGFFLYALYRALSPSVSFGTRPYSEGGGHLYWTASDGSFYGNNILIYFYLFGLFFGLLFTQPLFKGIVFIFGGLLLLGYTMFTKKSPEWGSVWCLYAILLSGLALLLEKI